MTVGANFLSNDVMGDEGEILVSVFVLRPVVAQLERMGHDGEAFVRGLGLDPAVLADRTARVPLSAAGFATERAAELSGDPCFGLHVAEHVDERSYDLLTYASATQATLGSAVESISRYFRLLGEVSRVQLEREGEDAIFANYLDLPVSPESTRQGTELAVAVGYVIPRRLVEGAFDLREVRFRHSAPQETTEHARIFGCPVRFGADINGIVFDPAMLELPLRTHDPTLAEILRAAADRALAQLPTTTSLATEVRRRLPELLTKGQASLATTARALAMSPRTLQRRLRAEGVGYQTILDGVRKELAQSYLAHEDLSAAEVAFLLGFSEPASFNRAFKRWTGTTPSGYRRGRR